MQKEHEDLLECLYQIKLKRYHETGEKRPSSPEFSALDERITMQSYSPFTEFLNVFKDLVKEGYLLKDESGIGFSFTRKGILKAEKLIYQKKHPLKFFYKNNWNWIISSSTAIITAIGVSMTALYTLLDFLMMHGWTFRWC